MNKFSALLAGVAVVAMASCSSDEPMGPTSSPIIDADAVYMAVNIKTTESRAYVPGVENEQRINDVRFFFFDAQGIYMTEAQVWNEGIPVQTEGSNVEYNSSAMIVLKGLKGKEAPKYMFTVVNAPDFQPASTLAATADIASSIGELTNFVMTTSSFIPANADKAYDANYPYVNVIQESDFRTEALTIDADGKVTDKAGATVYPIEIYIERLAAKVTIEGDTQFDITMTVAEDNQINDEANDNVAKTKLKLTITGMSVTNVEPQSYIAKHIVGFDALPADWTWNRAEDFRSLWGKSMLYGDNFDADKLVGSTFKKALDNGTNPVYTYETTNTLTNVINDADASAKAQRVYDPNVPCALITAKITREDGNEIELVKFQGNFYEKATFTNYILARLNAQPAGLSYYCRYDKDGAVGHRQIDGTYFEQVSAGTGIGHVTLTMLDDVQLYVKDAAADDDYGYSALSPEENQAAIDAINARIADIITATNPAEAFTDGMCYYTIPIRHLAPGSTGYMANAEGQFGLVRNHWYTLNITSVSKLGHGIFNPDDEIVKPEIPQDDTYGVAAQIHVLSWKIVGQNVAL